MGSKTVGIVVLILVIMLCCICVCCIGLTGFVFMASESPSEITEAFSDGFQQGYGIVEDHQEIYVDPSEVISDAVSDEAYEELQRLANTVTLKNDAREIAERLQGIENIPEVISTSAEPVLVGEQSNFWVIDGDTDENFETTATLKYATDHLYFWVENGVDYDQNDLEALADTFENEIYPTNREFFGSEWTPGIDGDEHIYILYSRGLGRTTAGYFSSNDSVHPLAAKYSNGHEMFLINADTVLLWEEYIYGTLAHEFQHMIHWNLDANEQSWVNEGFSELASLLNGYDPGGFDTYYFTDTDVQLNEWPNDPNRTSVHYGSSFLFMTYFLDRFDEDLTKTLVRSEANGFDSIDQVLRDADITDQLTGEPITADDVFVDWAMTNFLQNPRIADGRYDYYSYNPEMRSNITDVDMGCNSNWKAASVTQYGVDTIELNCSGTKTLEFDGANLVNLIPTDAYSGEYAFWSNQGDDSDMYLTRQFDFSDVSGPIEMSYYTWYDLEEDYDYVYVLTSTDNIHWDFVHTGMGTSYDPVGNNLGWAYNGVSDWAKESIDLSDFAGQEVYVRFEYITDAAVNGEGFLVDDISIPAIGYFTDFEEDDGGWESTGFILTQNELPQTFRISIFDNSQAPVIQKFTLDAGDTISVDIDFDEMDSVYLMVSGTTRYTRQLALYQYRFLDN